MNVFAKYTLTLLGEIRRHIYLFVDKFFLFYLKSLKDTYFESIKFKFHTNQKLLVVFSNYKRIKALNYNSFKDQDYYPKKYKIIINKMQARLLIDMK